MHLLPVYYTTTSNRKRKKQKKSKSLLAAEKEHAKFLKRMGVGSRSSVGLEQRSSKPWVTGSSPVESANQRSVAQPGSASGLGPEGRRFESCHSDQLKFFRYTELRLFLTIFNNCINIIYIARYTWFNTTTIHCHYY